MWNKIAATAAQPRERQRAPVMSGAVPEEWPNGSGLYREGTAHLKSDKGLLGRTFRRNGKYPAWRYVNGKYVFLGEYATAQRAMDMITGG